jgi:hypothetical protein
VANQMWPTKATEKEEGMENSLSQQELWNRMQNSAFQGYKNKKTTKKHVTADNYICNP